MTGPVQIGLPERLAVKVLRVYGDDELSDLPALMRASEASAEQIASQIARQAMTGAWRGRMTVATRDRIKLMIEQHFTPPDEPPAVDPLAESASRFAAHGAESRTAELEDAAAVTVLQAPSRLKIEDTRGSRS